jgi:hypothetical protein
MSGAIPPLPQYVFMAWWSVKRKHRVTLPFTFIFILEQEKLSKFLLYDYVRISLEQWYSTGGTRTPRGTRRHLRGYVTFKISIYILFHE